MVVRLMRTPMNWAQQPLRPGRPPEADVARTESEHVQQDADVGLIDLAIAVVFASVDQSRLALGSPAHANPADERDAAVQGRGNPPPIPAVRRVHNDQVSCSQGGVAAATGRLQQSGLFHGPQHDRP
jgi:hypothetical protein